MKARSLTVMGAGAVGGYAAIRLWRRARGSLPAEHSGARVVILGAGFGGMSAASRIAKLTGSRPYICLVDQRNYHLFTPMLYQVATCSVVPYDVAIPLRRFAMARGIEFRKATVTGIDFQRQQVSTDAGPIGYDYLIVALGSTTNFFGDPSAMRHATAMKSLEDGLTIRNRVIDALEEASRLQPGGERRERLTFVIIGGGSTGVETAGALADVVRSVVPKSYPAINADECRIVLIEAAPKLLGHMSAAMAALALKELKAAGVEVWLNTAAKNVGSHEVVTESGQTVKARMILWTAGVRAPDVIARLDASHDRDGSLVVNEFLQVPGHPNVFAVGDSAGIRQNGGRVPLLAASAMQEGHAAGSNLVRLLRGRPPAAFRYRNLGNIVSLGHHTGVAEIAGRDIDGLTGWLLWRVVHLARLTTFRSKVATALDWSTAWFYDMDTARLEVEERPPAAA